MAIPYHPPQEPPAPGSITYGNPAELLKQDPRKPADEVQVGGSHYKDMDIQPWHVMEGVLTPDEFIGFLKGNMIKYAMRQGRKDSPDAGKYRHYEQKLQEVLRGS